MTDTMSQYVTGRTIEEQMCNLMEFVSTVNGKSVRKMTSAQTGSTVTVTVTYEDDHTDTLTFQSGVGFVTLTGEAGSDQVIQNGGLQVVNGDVVASGEVEASSVHVSEDEGSMVTEINTDGSSVVSSSGKIYVKAEGTSGNDFVVGDDFCIVNSLKESTTPTAASDVKTATNIEYVSSTDGRNNLVHTNAIENISGDKNFMDGVRLVTSSVDITTKPATGNYYNSNQLRFRDKNSLDWISFRAVMDSTGKTFLQAVIRNSSGGYDYKTIVESS